MPGMTRWMGLVIGLAIPYAATAAPIVAVAPLAPSAPSSHSWIGPAMAHALSLRVHQQDDLRGLTLRQVNAAMRQDNIQPKQLAKLEQATNLGRQLGASILVSGLYTTKSSQIEITMQIVDPQQNKRLAEQKFQGSLDTLVQLETKLATAIAQALGADKPDVMLGAFGTTNVGAWQAATQGLGIVNRQSLSPRAADPSAPLKLPRSTVEQALNHFERATKLDPDYGSAWAGLGVAQALLGDTRNAWKSLGKATSLGFGHHPTAVLGAAFVRMREGDFDSAAKILHAAIQRHPGFLHARGSLGELYNHRGQHRHALKVFDAYAQLVPRQPWVLAQRGYTKGKLKDHVGAIADTLAALEILPNSPSILLQLASRYIDAKKLVGAEDTLRHGLQGNPNDPILLVRLGYVYLLQGKTEQAIPITEKALKIAGFGKNRRDQGYAHLNLARAYGHKGETDKALQHLTQAKEIGVSLAEVDTDPRLRKLRSDPRYRALAP